MKEVWKDIKGYEGSYKVSNLGRIQSNKNNRPKILKFGYNAKGYDLVHLCKHGEKKSFKVHRLVLIAFDCNLDNKPQVNHIDGNKNNNNLFNLEWCTNKENIEHAVKTGLLNHTKNRKTGYEGTAQKLKKLEVLEIIKKYKTGKYTQLELGTIYGVSQVCVSKIVNKVNWKWT